MTNLVLVKIEGELRDHLKIKTDQGGVVKLYLETSYRPMWNANIRGTVQAVCEKSHFNEFEKDPDKSLEWDTEIDVQKGDEVVFDYNAIGHNFNIDSNNKVNPSKVIRCEDDLYVFMKYDYIYVRVRDGEERPVNGYVLAVPEEVDPLKKRVESVGLDASVIEDEGIYFKVVKMAPMNKAYRGRTQRSMDRDGISSRAQSVLSDFGELKEGDVVMLENKAYAYPIENDILQTLEHKYIAFQRRWVSCVISLD